MQKARRRAVRSAEAFAAERDRLSDDMRTSVPPSSRSTVERIVRMSHVPHRWQVACVACGGARGAPRTHNGGAQRERRAVSLAVSTAP